GFAEVGDNGEGLHTPGVGKLEGRHGRGAGDFSLGADCKCVRWNLVEVGRECPERVSRAGTFEVGHYGFRRILRKCEVCHCHREDGKHRKNPPCLTVQHETSRCAQEIPVRILLQSRDVRSARSEPCPRVLPRYSTVTSWSRPSQCAEFFQ